MVPALPLATALGGTVRQDGAWVTVVISRQDFGFLPHAPLFRLNDRVEPLAVPAFERGDSLFVPYQFVAEILPRYLGELYRFDRVAGRLVQLGVGRPGGARAEAPAERSAAGPHRHGRRRARRSRPRQSRPVLPARRDGEGRDPPGRAAAPGRARPARHHRPDDPHHRHPPQPAATARPPATRDCDLFVSLHVDALDPRTRRDYRSVERLHHPDHRRGELGRRRPRGPDRKRGAPLRERAGPGPRGRPARVHPAGPADERVPPRVRARGRADAGATSSPSTPARIAACSSATTWPCSTPAAAPRCWSRWATAPSPSDAKFLDLEGRPAQDRAAPSPTRSWTTSSSSSGRAVCALEDPADEARRCRSSLLLDGMRVLQRHVQRQPVRRPGQEGGTGRTDVRGAGVLGARPRCGPIPSWCGIPTASGRMTPS